jgi:ABC-type phosphate/phosphonate transport system substrate-binding protein
MIQKLKRMIVENYWLVSVVDLVGKMWSFRNRSSFSGRLVLSAFLMLAGLGKLIKAVLDSSSPEASILIVGVSVVEVWCAVGLINRCTNTQSVLWFGTLLDVWI